MVTDGRQTIFAVTDIDVETLTSKNAFFVRSRKRIRNASIYTSKKISLKLLFLSDIFLFPFIRQQVTVLA